jgi:hypothetical protein
MKQSEMQHLIMMCIERNWEDSNNLGLARCILRDMEEAGMTPPAIKIPCPTHYIDATGQVKQGEDSTVFVNEWEPENE